MTDSSKRIYFPILVLALFCLGAFLLVATAPSVQTVAPERTVAAVRVLTPEPRSVQLSVRTQGTVAPRTESTLVPEVSGRVTWISPALVSGGFFAAGEVLLRLDRRESELAVSRARAALVRAESELAFASEELDRQQGLSQRKVASPSQLSAAQRARRVAKAGVDEARAALEQAQWDLERTAIIAPFQGRVRDEQVDVGQFVTRGAPVATLYATDYAEIRLPIADHQLAYLELPSMRRGSDDPESAPRVKLHARFAGRDLQWRGRIVRTEGEIDARSRMVHVVARVEDPYGMQGGTDARDQPPLAVGLFVHAEISGPTVEGVLVVPRYAMRDETTLLVVDADDRLRLREVEVLRIDRDEVLIKGALAPGERICLSPLQVVVEGMPVRPIRDDADAVASAKSGLIP